jgi:glutamyl-Q tRNA(Asp) synthetase
MRRNCLAAALASRFILLSYHVSRPLMFLKRLERGMPPGSSLGSIITRFAPSPTGLLHLGHAASAFLAHGLARRAGGQFLLRLEDIDPTRCRPGYAEALEEDLLWLGLSWDGPVRIQSAHLPEYATVLDQLRARGLLYPCFCSRAEIASEAARVLAAPHGPDGAPLYPGTCRGLPAVEREARIAGGAPHVWRLSMAAARAVAGRLSYHERGQGRQDCHPEVFGDVVLARRDVPASYHLCVTHDDALQGVTLITRGADLRHATHLHRLLQALQGWPEPGYAHHPLLTDSAGRRFAKRDNAVTLRALREAGATPASILSQFATRAGFALG